MPDQKTTLNTKESVSYIAYFLTSILTAEHVTTNKILPHLENLKHISKSLPKNHNKNSKIFTPVQYKYTKSNKAWKIKLEI